MPCGNLLVLRLCALIPFAYSALESINGLVTGATEGTGGISSSAVSQWAAAPTRNLWVVSCAGSGPRSSGCPPPSLRSRVADDLGTTCRAPAAVAPCLPTGRDERGRINPTGELS